MESNLVECSAERCAGGSLGVLEDVRRAYEERMALVERVGGTKKLQMQVEVLRSWVGDLMGQNSLLARAVEQLEAKAISHLLERRRHAEIVSELEAEAAALRGRLARSASDLQGLLELLRRMREFDCFSVEGIHFFEVTESDIFGSDDGLQKKIKDGNMKRHRLKHEFNGIGDYRRFTLL